MLVKRSKGFTPLHTAYWRSVVVTCTTRRNVTAMVLSTCFVFVVFLPISGCRVLNVFSDIYTRIGSRKLAAMKGQTTETLVESAAPSRGSICTRITLVSCRDTRLTYIPDPSRYTMYTLYIYICNQVPLVQVCLCPGEHAVSYSIHIVIPLTCLKSPTCSLFAE